MKASRFVLLMIFFIVVGSISGVTYAGDNMLEKVTSENYAVRAPYRALQGVINGVLCWTQLYVEPVHSVKYEDQNVVNGLVDGFAKTLYYAVVGVWDMGTFWVPGKGGIDIAVKECVTSTFKRE